MADSMAETSFGKGVRNAAPPLSHRLGPMVLLYWLVSAAALLAFTLPGVTGSVMTENDDVMRLVEVRDFMAGQGWFDLMQYRLGLAEGTLMHWSRLIDLPIALLIRFFSLFMATPRAEEWAATAWPVLLIPFLLLPLGISARRLGGAVTMHVALGFGALFIFTCVRFAPGSLDHHNVQLVLVMWIAAMLCDPGKRASSYVIAGLSCALAIAIGVETTPFVAVACICVALQWLWHGRDFAGPARAFGLSLTVSVTALFVLTIPPHAYAAVTCDNLSLGFYTPAALGGSALFLLASLPGNPPRAARAAMMGTAGGLLFLAAWVVAPECLRDPMGSFDPLLVQLWLRGVTEARSFAAQVLVEPEMVGGFYAVGLFAMVACLFRAVRGERSELHLLLLSLVGISWAVALFQVRGTFFANMLAILPLSLMITDLRRLTVADPKNSRLALGYVAAVLASVPVVWAVVGMAAIHGPWQAGNLKAITGGTIAGHEIGECGGATDMAALNALQTGVVAGPSNSGADILRSTRHRVLSAPYHRDQKGMLTELYIGLSQPDEALAFLKGAGVTILAFCKTDPQTATLARMKPDGLYSALTAGKVPDYLQPAAKRSEGGFELFQVRTGTN